ncbi:Sua5/YciO/YrdC/YwlC family protein, partial [Klebsiella pneumoniae]|uniref:Sua5/YciO/YrdC/YwlC family protein n=1 Tax=Klebsiella pneumoniae TaxID=573 RepID=UPI00210AB051
ASCSAIPLLWHSCDAGNPAAVATLRARKHRPAKPLAVMLPTATGLPAAAAALMGSPAAPIVLIAKAQVSGLCDEIAPGIRCRCGPLPTASPV